MVKFYYDEKEYVLNNITRKIRKDARELLNIGVIKYITMCREGDIELFLAIMYCSIIDKNTLTFEQFKNMKTKDMFELLGVYKELCSRGV